MRYTLEREQNRNAAISVGVRPAAHNSRTCTASKAPDRASRNLANIHSCSCGGMSCMVESCTVMPPRYLDVVLQLSKYQRGRHCANLMHLGLAGLPVFDFALLGSGRTATRKQQVRLSCNSSPMLPH